MPIISDGNNQIGDEVTDQHMTVGVTKHTGSYVISGSGGNYLLIGSDDMTTAMSMAPGGMSANITPHIGVFENRPGLQPTVGISRGDNIKSNGGDVSLFRFSSTGSVGNGDVLGTLTSMGHDGTDFNMASQIKFSVDGNVNTDGMPSKIELLTNPGDGSTVFPSTRVTIGANGNVGIGTSGQSDLLAVNGSVNFNGDLALDSSSQPTLSFKESSSDRAEIGINDSDNLLITNQSSNKYIVFKTNDAGTVREGLRVGGTVPEVVVNEGSDSLVDFRVESDNNRHMIFVDGGNDRVGINSDSPSCTLEVVNNNVQNVTAQLTSTSDDSSASPILKLKRNSASPADADYLGQIKFSGENDADQEVNYAKITGKIDDASDGTEDGILEFANIKAGSQTITARLRSDSFQLLNSTNLVVNGTTNCEGNLSFPDVLISELSIPGIDLQVDSGAYRFNCPYNLTVTGLRLHLDQHSTSGDVTVTVTNSTTSSSMISLSVTGTNLSANTTTVSNASAAQGDALTFAITATPANAQNLRATLEFKRDL